jgi:hypothetical protein
MQGIKAYHDNNTGGRMTFKTTSYSKRYRTFVTTAILRPKRLRTAGTSTGILYMVEPGIVRACFIKFESGVIVVATTIDSVWSKGRQICQCSICKLVLPAINIIQGVKG